MPVTFISNGYSPYVGDSWPAAHPSIGLSKYGVHSPTHWQVTAVAGQDRTVSIAAGMGHGVGVTDKTADPQPIQLDPSDAGPRWDLIALRRDWNTAESKFVKVNGGPTRKVTLARNSTPGNIDDQPLALVKVDGAQPLEIVDLRTWAGDGGTIVANDEMVKEFLNKAGTQITINGAGWTRTPELKWELTSPIIKAETRVFPVTNSNGDAIYTFPTAFPAALTSVVVTDAQSTGNYGAVNVKVINELTDRTRVCLRFMNPNSAPLVGLTLKASFVAVGY